MTEKERDRLRGERTGTLLVTALLHSTAADSDPVTPPEVPLQPPDLPPNCRVPQPRSRTHWGLSEATRHCAVGMGPLLGAVVSPEMLPLRWALNPLSRGGFAQGGFALSIV